MLLALKRKFHAGGTVTSNTTWMLGLRFFSGLSRRSSNPFKKPKVLLDSDVTDNQNTKGDGSLAGVCWLFQYWVRVIEDSRIWKPGGVLSAFNYLTDVQNCSPKGSLILNGKWPMFIFPVKGSWRSCLMKNDSLLAHQLILFLLLYCLLQQNSFRN